MSVDDNEALFRTKASLFIFRYEKSILSVINEMGVPYYGITIR